MNKILGYPDTKIDKVAIEKVNKDRLKNLKLDEFEKDFKAKKKVMWICGFPGAGKTFLGDYLATKGWHHIDGDMGNQSPDPEVRAKMNKMFTLIMQKARGTVNVDANDWKPYYELLVSHMKEA